MSIRDEMIEDARNGERISNELSMHICEIVDINCNHHWRTILCHNGTDVRECSKCGRQTVTACNFDDDYY